MDMDETIMEVLGKLGEENSKELAEAVEKISKNVFEKGMLPKDAMGLSDSMVEGIYGYAYRLYNSGKYRDASHLFRILILLNPTESKYILGMAACQHMQQDYKNAIATYAFIGLIDPYNPLPHYHVSDCYIKTGLIPMAKAELEQAIEKCGSQPQYALIKERAELMWESLEKGQTTDSTAAPEMPRS